MKDKRLKNLGLNIKIERIKKELSQEKLAEMSNISLNTLGQTERGESHPLFYTVFDIANALEIDINELTKNI